MPTIISFVSGNGGTGKTTSCAAFAMEIAQRGHKTAAIDFNTGLRSLDLATGNEKRVLFDVLHVMDNEATLDEALIADRNNNNLYLLAAPQSHDSSAITEDGIAGIFNTLDKAGFAYILCDCPPGLAIEARLASNFTNFSIICVTPDRASVRCADRLIGLLQDAQDSSLDKNRQELILINRMNPEYLLQGYHLSVESITNTLAVPILALIPECSAVARANGTGQPVTTIAASEAAGAYKIATDQWVATS